MNYTFHRPHRSRLVKVVNWMGRRRPPRRLSAEEIVATASRRQGISGWDDHSFLEPLEILLNSYEEETGLTPAGILMIRGYLIRLATDQISQQDWIRRHPEILQEEVGRPLVVLGMPRTGTSFLYSLLARHPGFRPVMFWETLRPRPRRAFPGRRLRREQLRARIALRVMHRLAPQFGTTHPVDPMGPEECTSLMMQTFVSPSFSMTCRLQSYMEWLRSRDLSFFLPRYRHFLRTLQMLQWERPPKEWVLKSLGHMGSLEGFLEGFPNACVVHLHRDMKEVLPSLGSLTAVARGIYSDDVGSVATERRGIGSALRQIQEYEHARANYPGRILDLRFKDLVENPVETVQQVFERFGYGWDGEAHAAVSRAIRDDPHKSRPKHRYSLAQFGMTAEEVDARFKDYSDKFLGAD